MSDLVSGSSEAAGNGDGFEWVAGLNGGFLGTGSSTLVELSYVAMALIAGYVAIGTVRYFFPDLNLTAKLAEALGLR